MDPGVSLALLKLGMESLMKAMRCVIQLTAAYNHNTAVAQEVENSEVVTVASSSANMPHKYKYLASKIDLVMVQPEGQPGPV